MTTSPQSTGHAGVMDVRYVARLVRMDLTAEEVARYQEQLDHILAYIQELEGLDVAGVEPMSHAQDLCNVLREDTPRASLPPEAPLRNAPQTRDGLFVVPRIIE